MLRGLQLFPPRPSRPLEPPPLLATVFFGANDSACIGRGSARQHVPLPRFAANLKAIKSGLERHGVQNVVLMAPPPVSEAAWLAEVRARGEDAQEPDRLDAVARQYAHAVCQVRCLRVFCCRLTRLTEGLQLTRPVSSGITLCIPKAH